VLGAEERLRALEVHLFEAAPRYRAVHQPTSPRTADVLAALDGASPRSARSPTAVAGSGRRGFITGGSVRVRDVPAASPAMYASRTGTGELRCLRPEDLSLSCARPAQSNPAPYESVRQQTTIRPHDLSARPL